MLSRKAFFSFVTVTDPARHHDYNAWHQLDHLPENLALPGVAHGERWVQTPACAAAGAAPAGALAGVHYVAAYWFADPADRSMVEWQDLAEQSFQWGRRPDMPFVARPLMGFFSVVAARVSPRLPLSPEALPMRPKRGVYVSLFHLSEPHSGAAERAFRWHEEEGIPANLELPGVAGAYVFSSDSTTLDEGWSAPAGTTTFDPGQGERGQFRIHLYFLDGDPLEAAAALDRSAGDAEALEPYFSSPCESIIPNNWDFFVREAGK